MSEKVNYLIDMIKDMDIQNKLRLAVRINESVYSHISYNKVELFKYYDKLLKENDCTYTMSFMNFNEYPLINFAMAKIMEMTPTEQNQVALYLFNSIEFKIKNVKALTTQNKCFKI